MAGAGFVFFTFIKKKKGKGMDQEMDIEGI